MRRRRAISVLAPSLYSRILANIIMIVWVSTALAVAASSDACFAHCEEPCEELNGDLESECGGCTGAVSCKPGAPGFGTSSAVVDANGGAVDGGMCRDMAGEESCARLAKTRGGCDQPLASFGSAMTASPPTLVRVQMRRHCAQTCGYCDGGVPPPCASEPCMSSLSLSGEHLNQQHGQLPSCPTSAALVGGSRRCGDLIDQRRIKDRGYFVLRDAVPADELEQMAADEAIISYPLTPRELEERYPAFHSNISRILDGWLASGMNEVAALGWPLEIVDAAFVSARHPVNIIPDVWRTGGGAHMEEQRAYGRRHFAYMIIRRADTREADLRAVPAAALYARGSCTSGVHGLVEGSAEMPLLDHLGCDVSLARGELVFVREDVWHRIHASQHVGLLVTISRYPLVDTLASTPLLPARRVPQPSLLNSMLALSARVWQTLFATPAHFFTGACARAEDVASLPERGFVVVRNALSRTSLDAALAALHRRLDVQNFEPGEGQGGNNTPGRRYSETISQARLEEEAPTLVEELQLLLNRWRAESVVPRSHAPGTAEFGAPLRLFGGQWVLTNATEARANGCDTCAFTPSRCAPACTDILRSDWHVDSAGVRGVRMHKIWVMLWKEERDGARGHANVNAVPSDGLEVLAAAVLEDYAHASSQSTEATAKSVKVFEFMDADGSGEVDADEFTNGIEATPYLRMLKERQRRKLMSRVDTDSNGGISLSELAHWLQKLTDLGRSTKTDEETSVGETSRADVIQMGDEEVARMAASGRGGAAPHLSRMLDAVGCLVELDPGDVLFWSEDVFHRTQDTLAHRFALLLNVI